MQIASLLYELRKLVNNMFNRRNRLKDIPFDRFKIKFEKQKPKREMTIQEFSAWGIARWCAMLGMPPPDQEEGK